MQLLKDTLKTQGKLDKFHLPLNCTQSCYV